MPLPKRRTQRPAELRAVQIVEGDAREVTEVVATLRKAGCVVESVLRLGPDKWEVTARSDDA